MNYEQLCQVLRQHAEFKLPEGFSQFGCLDDCSDAKLLPRAVLREAIASPNLGCDPTAALYDLFAVGMEWVLLDQFYKHRERLDPEYDKGYEIEFIAAFNERCCLGGGDSGSVRTLCDEFDDLEDRRQILHEWRWDTDYLLCAHGLHSANVALLADYPDRLKVYHVSLYEGEGWWTTFTFALRLPS